MGRSEDRTRVASLEPLTRLLLDALGEGVYGIDAEGCATFLKPAAESLLGYRAGGFIGYRQHDRIHHCRESGEPYPPDECPIYAVLRDGVERHITGELFWRSDGSSFPVEYTVAPVADGGAVVGAVVVFRDISERLEAQTALHQAHELQQALLENLPDAAWMKDADLRYGAVNETFLRAAGRSREAFLGNTVYDVLPRATARAYDGGDRRVLDRNETVSREELLPWGEGRDSLRWIETVKRPLPRIDGRPTGLVGTARDVTDRKRREETDRFLAEAGEVIIASLAWSETLQGLSTLGVPALDRNGRTLGRGHA